ncbi:MAG: glycosyltransferase [Anaerolineae bacterium]|nr:glycosyltransferase [Anaerolineae bacterium]
MLGGQVGASDPSNALFLAEVQAQAQALGVASALVWTDFLPEAEVSAALISADMAVLPYREGVSLQRGTLMAALAHGLPIVTTRPPVPPPPSPLPRLVDDVNAVLAPPDDPAALADAVARLWADPARRVRLGAAAQGLAQAFRWERIAQQHVEWYKGLMTKD